MYVLIINDGSTFICDTLDEGTYFPAISLGLRDFIGTGWYSSEYIVATKNAGNLEITAGLGYGRIAGRNSFPNPLSLLKKPMKKSIKFLPEFSLN